MRNRRIGGFVACLVALSPLVAFTSGPAGAVGAPALDTTTPLVNPYTGWLIDGSAQDARGAYFPLASRTTAFADDAPNYSMVMDTVAWADLQPTSADTFDFAEIDNLIAYWKPRGKKVVVKIISTDDPGWHGPGREVRPGWLIADPSLTWKPYSFGGFQHVEPDYLDGVHFPNFMTRWTNLINHVAAHYAGSKDVVGFIVGWGNWGEGGNTTASATNLGTARQTISAGFVNAAKNAFANTGIPVVTYAYFAGAGTLSYANQNDSIAFDTGPDALEGIASGGYDGGTQNFKLTPQWSSALANHWYRFQDFGETNYTPDDGTLWTNAFAGNGYANQFRGTHVDYAQLWMNSNYYNDATVNTSVVKANIAAGLVGGGLGCRLAVSATDVTAGVLHVTFVNQNAGTCFQNPPVYVYVHGVASVMLPAVAGKDLSKLEQSTTDCADTNYCATSVTYQVATSSLPAFTAGDHAYVAVGAERTSERLWLGNLLPTDAAGAAITTGLGTDVSKRAVVRYDIGPLGINGGGGGDSTRPTVSLTAPAAGAIVSGPSITLSAAAGDNVGVVSVQFQLDGTNVGPALTSAPYVLSWDSTAVADGSHTLTAIARDAAGNQATASPVGVTVANTSGVASIAFVRSLGTSTLVGTDATISLTVPAPGVAAGDTVVVWAGISGGNGNTVSSIVDSNGNSYTVDSTLKNPATGLSTFVGSGFAPGGLAPGSTITVRFAQTYFNLRELAAAEFSGLDAANRLDATASGTGNSAAPASAATATTSLPGELIVGGFGSSSVATFTPAAGFTALPTAAVSASGTSRSLYSSYEVVQSAGRYSASGTLSAANYWTAATVTYKGTGAGGGDTTPPTVAVTAPADGATVNGVVTVAATAADNTAVVDVQFLLDGEPLGAADTTAPYSVSWDTTTATAGAHTLAAVARDGAGNATTAAAVGVTVQQPAPGPGPAFVKDLGSTTVVNTGGSLQLTIPAGGVAAGQTIVVWAEMSGSGGVTIASITDSRGNAYTADAAINNQGVNTLIGSGFVATPLAGGDTISVTFSGSYFSLRLLRAAAFSGLSSTGRLDQKATGTGNNTGPSTALTPTTAQASELLVGAVGTSTTAPLTAGAGYTALPPATTSGSGVTRSITPMYRVATATGAYQATGTLTTPAVWSAALATYR